MPLLKVGETARARGQVDRGRSASIGGDAWQVLNWPIMLVVPRRSVQPQIRRRSPAGMRRWQHILRLGGEADAPGIAVSRNWFMRVADCLDVGDAVLLKWFCRKFIDAGDPY